MAPLLLTEDDANDVFLFGCAFKQAGLSNPLLVARDGQQAIDFLELLSNYRDRLLHPLPGLLLLDLKMPRLSGFDVLNWLRGRSDFKSVPVVVLSSSPQAPDMLLARELGAADYRVKPAQLPDLVKLLQELHCRWLGGRATAAPVLPESSPRMTTPRLGIAARNSSGSAVLQSELA